MPRAPRASSKPTLTLTDPRSLRALAHPARQVLIAELTSGRVLTATEAADLVGLSPSAVSHHLRALERYGIAERAESPEGADARTRPWRSRYRELTFNPTGPGSASGSESLIRTHLARVADAYVSAVRSGGTGSESRQVGFTVAESWLTDDERLDLLDRVADLLDTLPHRNARDHPAGATHIQLTIAHVPLEDHPTD